ncbi:signal recognition particle-docking protein FtsY [Desulfobotulus sp. H1]|uniref:Signal recognition particle receptor FtsY n=1 Tax=Desulfobotulus pelophilus TaxID=2823377 RepID=A0ABT3NAD6_9BACT|nr:signal recognition particle-docking protein FtsY [Desulfobotulus pelophilus]MCW7754414.1 signal recognition particle-docking protein FtsY [Desulfobotulus pelophilus]
MSFSLFGKKSSKKNTVNHENGPKSSTLKKHEPPAHDRDPSLPVSPDSAVGKSPSQEQENLQPEATGGLFKKLKQGLSKTREFLTTDVDDLLLGRKLDENLLEDLEEKLITADIGVTTAMDIVERIRVIRGRIHSSEDLKARIREEILKEVPTGPAEEQPYILSEITPRVILVVGVNGAGKTTTIGKLAARYGQEGKKVVLAAGDTFRAAASEQLELWARRSGATLIRHKDRSDPAAVAYDALDASIARNADVLIVDTAGRLHNKVNLMEELKKIHRTLDKRMPGAPHETLLVLDATTGQNALRQAELFHEAIGLTGLVLTKLDGTARGGIVIAIQKHLGLPVRYVGVGEGVEDLQPFDMQTFVQAMV